MLVLTDDGKTYSGLIAKETTELLTMVIGAGKLQEIAVDSIEERRNINVSSMPENLHESISAKEFVDLLQYLKEQKAKVDSE